LETLCGAWPRALGEPSGHDIDHGQVDHGLVVGGEPLVVPGGAPVAGDPGQGPLDHPASGQDVQVIGVLDDLEGELEWLGRFHLALP
jgi:hypothetical protein